MQREWPYLKKLLYQCQQWLATHAHHNLGTEITLSNMVGGNNWYLQVARSGHEVKGVSLVTPTKNWFLEADSSNTAIALAALTCRHRIPHKLTCSGLIAGELRTFLLQITDISREHYLDVMTTKSQTRIAEGKWAEPRHIPLLESYQQVYNQERSTRISPDWNQLIANRQIAILEENDNLLAVVKQCGLTRNYACVGGTFTFGQWREQGHGTQVMGFIVNRLLQEKDAVHLIVDDDNEAAKRLYRRCGFAKTGKCYMAYLGDRA